jgi:hypothetical protein
MLNDHDELDYASLPVTKEQELHRVLLSPSKRRRPNGLASTRP